MAEERGTARKRQAQRSRQDIVDAYRDLIRERGMDNFTVRDICARLNISVGRFYHHFPSKDAVMEVFYFQFSSTIEQRLLTLPAGEPEGQLLEFFDCYCGYNVEFGLEFCQKFFAGTNHSFLSDKNSLTAILRGIVGRLLALRELEGRYDREELVGYFQLLGRGVMLDWAIHNGSYDPRARMAQVISRGIAALGAN